MTKPAENPEKNQKRPAWGKICYVITMTVLVGMVLVCGWMYLQPHLPADLALVPTESTAPATEPTTVPSGVPPTEPAPTEPPVQTGTTDIRLNIHEGPVSLLSQSARDYLAAENVPDVTAFLSHYWDWDFRADRGRPVELSYAIYSLPQGVEVKNAVLRLFVPDGSGTYTDYIPAKGSKKVSVYNLRTGTQYHYSGIFTLTDGSKITLSGSFKTAAGPRLMHIDGLVNVRDLGGWTTVEGKTVNQGLLYRGSEMDGLVESDFKLTPQGLEQMKALGIKTDLDLRHEGENVLGGKHILYNAIQYEYAFTDVGKDAVRRLFADLADPANYPAYLHCTYGADRTGTMCYLLLGLLGVSDADLKRDYELTALYYGCVSPAQMDPFVAKIAALPGENTRQRVEYFLENAGVTRDQMDSIRQIFLG